MSSEYAYLAEVWPEDTVDAPTALWRRSNGGPEYLSSIDWQWYAGAKEFADRPSMIFVAITAAQVQALQTDRQRFVRYWSYQHPNGEGKPEKENRVYRQRRSPDRVLDEVFGPDNEWVVTRLISEFTFGSPADRPEMIAIDQAAAEQLIQQTRGMTGATEL